MSGRFDLRIVLYLLPAAVILFFSLCLTECISASPGIPAIFMVTLHETTHEAGIQLRVGYFGLCSLVGSNATCAPTFGLSAQQAIRTLSLSPDQVTNDSVSIALALQRNMFAPLLAASAILFLLALASFVQLQRLLKRQNGVIGTVQRRRILWKRITLGLLGISIALVLASVTSLTQASSALQALTHANTSSTYLIENGLVMQVLKWLTLSLAVSYALGIFGLFEDLAAAAVNSAKATGMKSASGGLPPLPPPPPPPP